MNKRRTLLAFAGLLGSGCVDSSAFLLGDAQVEPRAPEHAITVYDTFADVPYRYTKVARVVASGSGHAAWDRVFEALERRAREVGGDALVLQRGGEDTADLDGEGSIAMRRTLWALAIRRQTHGPLATQ